VGHPQNPSPPKTIIVFFSKSASPSEAFKKVEEKELEDSENPKALLVATLDDEDATLLLVNAVGAKAAAKAGMKAAM